MSEKTIYLQQPFIAGTEQATMADVLNNSHYFMQRHYAAQCLQWFKQHYSENTALLTNTCTSALEIICLAENLQAGDEVIMPSFTYVSTANAFAKFNVTPVFVDISPDDLNINAAVIEQAITPKTKAVVIVHYAGVSCNLSAISAVCKKHQLLLVEDAAHGIGAKYETSPLGTIADYGVISFDHTKNIHCGQGGILFVNNPGKVKTVELIYENGTNRADFVSKEVRYFEWLSKGSKYLLSDLNAAFLLVQLQHLEQVNALRLKWWNYYYQQLSLLPKGLFELPHVPQYAKHNAHIFYIKLRDTNTRERLTRWLNSHGIESAFHFIPLHSSAYGKAHGRFSGKDIYTTTSAGQILRLPLHHTLTQEDIDFVVQKIREFVEH